MALLKVPNSSENKKDDHHLYSSQPKPHALSKLCVDFACRLCLLSYGLGLCSAVSANFIGAACRFVSIEVLHNTPDGSESFHPTLLIKEIVPLRALQLRTAPVFFGESLLGHGPCGQILGVSIVDGEFENADVVEEAGDQENLCNVSDA